MSVNLPGQDQPGRGERLSLHPLQPSVPSHTDGASSHSSVDRTSANATQNSREGSEKGGVCEYHPSPNSHLEGGSGCVR